MGRRKGIIALLAGTAASLMGQTTGTGTATKLSMSSRLSLRLTDSGDDYGISGIDVHYGDRIVRLTPAEIMDAIEAKPADKVK